MSARLVVALAVAAAGLVVPVVPGTAAADPRITVTDVDSHVPGRVTATVHTTLDRVEVGLLDERSQHVRMPTGAHRRFDVVDGTVRVDLATWGLEPGLTHQIEVGTCPERAHDCETTTAPFVPTDSPPTLRFSPDAELTGTEQATLHVENAGPGLEAVVGAIRTQPLHDGEQVLRLHEGRFTVFVRRCGYSACNEYERQSYTVRKGALESQGWTPAEVRPDDSTTPDSTALFRVGDTVPYRFDGQLATSSRTPEAVAELSVGDLRPDADGIVGVPVDLTPHPHGQYFLTGRFSRSTADGEVVQHVDSRLVSLDLRGPRVLSTHLSTGEFHPVPDGYRDRVRLEGNQVDADAVSAVVTMRHDDTGREVVVPSDLDHVTLDLTARWDGHTPDGSLAPAGRWTAVVDAVDRLGNHERTLSDTVRLTHRALVPVRRTFRVSAAGSHERTRSGRCGAVNRGADGWDDGLAYRVGSCSNRARAQSRHSFLGLPSGWLRGTVTVGGYGRSARHRPGRLPPHVTLSVASNVAPTRMSARSGWYETRPLRDRVLEDDGRLRWSVTASHATRYDVRGFRITFDGVALR